MLCCVSLVVQCLKLCLSNAGGTCSILGWEFSHTVRPKTKQNKVSVVLFFIHTFNLYASLYLKWVSFKQHRDGSCFFMHSDNLFYLVHLDHWHSERSFCHSWSIVYSINYYFLFVALVLCPYFCVQLLFCFLQF